ncbi:hypothetical protein JOB18_014769 [Solea senegalensis]|uniref:Uncharacterized protein n=1 Tax=Solea senegalensis TaxID=28829 RepID=A0AAV6SIY3_SOLSE|nr:hypothetical protein JOB18_014769 [Solea senegalensis]
MAARSSSSDGKERLSSPVDLNYSDSFCDLSDSFLVARDYFKKTPTVGPLAILKDQFLSDSPARDILNYVSDFRSRLHRAHDLARENLERAQGKMKAWYDRKAVVRHFEVFDQILVLLPIPGSALQARYSGPYELGYLVVTVVQNVTKNS